MKVKRFVESKDGYPPSIQYYDLESGIRCRCDDKTFNALWQMWRGSGNISRETDHFYIFEFREPLECDLRELKNTDYPNHKN